MIIPIFYFGSIDIWVHILKARSVRIEANENYQKKSQRNKSTILCSSGPQLLSIPLQKGKHQKRKIKEVKISYDENWPKLHLKKVEDAYGQAPYYSFYIEELSNILSSDEPLLYNLNFRLINWLAEKMDLDLSLIETFEYKKDYPTLKDLRTKYSLSDKMTTILETPYPQVFESDFGFMSNLSIIDLLMNQGPESKVYLKEINLLMTKS